MAGTQGQRRILVSIPQRYLILAGTKGFNSVEELIEGLITDIAKLEAEIESYKNELEKLNKEHDELLKIYNEKV